MKSIATPVCRAMPLVVLLFAMAGLSACDKATGASREVQSVTRKAFNETQSSWRDFFTYHPPQPEPLPQTRYCYQMQSDVVCYDSEQRAQTAKLLGYQDGENIAWVQPGGGSLGASGGPPVALRPQAPARGAGVMATHSGNAGGYDTVSVDTDSSALAAKNLPAPVAASNPPVARAYVPSVPKASPTRKRASRRR